MRRQSEFCSLFKVKNQSTRREKQKSFDNICTIVVLDYKLLLLLIFLVVIVTFSIKRLYNAMPPYNVTSI